MGNTFSISCLRSRRISQQNNEPPVSLVPPIKPSCSVFYSACRAGDYKQVNLLLSSMSINEINRIEPNGSTALHAACYYGYYDIVRMLLDAGASRSIRNRCYNLTPFEEANTKEIQRLFTRVNNKTCANANLDVDRFGELSKHVEWMIESEQAARWKTNLYRRLRIEKSFDEMIKYLKEVYINEHVIVACNSEREKQVIQWFFNQATQHHDATYIIKAYTSNTPFYAIVNNHFAQFLLRFFRWKDDMEHPNVLEKSIGYIASILVHNSDLRGFAYTGRTYRGMILYKQDLAAYSINKRLLNKSFLSTSGDRRVAEIFAGVDNSKYMRRTLNDDLLQYMTICIFEIKNPQTALYIGSISEMPMEHEVIIMPLCAFQIKTIKECSNNNNNETYLEITLEECTTSHSEDVFQSMA